MDNPIQQQKAMNVETTNEVKEEETQASLQNKNNQENNNQIASYQQEPTKQAEPIVEEDRNEKNIDSSSSIQFKANVNANQKVEADDKDKIILTAKELSVMNKQLKKLEKLKKQNEQLKKHITNLEQIHNEQLKKQNNSFINKSSTKIQGLEETIKQLQRLLNQSNSNQQIFQREAAKSKQLYRNQKQMNSGLKVEIDQLRSMSSEHFLLKQQISRLNNQCKKLREANEAYPHLKADYEALESRLEKANKQLTTREQQVSHQAGLRLKLQKKLQTLFEQKRIWEKERVNLICQKQQAMGECDALKQQIEDERAEKQLGKKKNLNELKQLKIALHQEHEKLKLTEIQVQQLQQQLDHHKIKSKTNIEETVRYADLTKEDLFNLVEEAEMKIVALKMAVNDGGEQIDKLQKSIKQKNEAIFALSRELTKAYPSLDESEGMEYVEKDIIAMGLAAKDDWGEIVEKVMLQNLRLKYSVTALGEQYNNQMRKKQQK